MDAFGNYSGVTSAGDGLPTPINANLNYTVAGETHAFYIASADKAASLGFNYTVGTARNVFASDTNIEILEGSSSIYPFGTVFSPRVFNGTVYYTTGAGGPTINFDCSNLGETKSK